VVLGRLFGVAGRRKGKLSSPIMSTSETPPIWNSELPRRRFRALELLDGKGGVFSSSMDMKSDIGRKVKACALNWRLRNDKAMQCNAVDVV
jgi:hypothetical protein